MEAQAAILAALGIGLLEFFKPFTPVVAKDTEEAVLDPNRQLSPHYPFGRINSWKGGWSRSDSKSISR